MMDFINGIHHWLKRGILGAAVANSWFLGAHYLKEYYLNQDIAEFKFGVRLVALSIIALVYIVIFASKNGPKLSVATLFSAAFNIAFLGLILSQTVLVGVLAVNKNGQQTAIERKFECIALPGGKPMWYYPVGREHNRKNRVTKAQLHIQTEMSERLRKLDTITVEFKKGSLGFPHSPKWLD